MGSTFLRASFLSIQPECGLDKSQLWVLEGGWRKHWSCFTVSSLTQSSLFWGLDPTQVTSRTPGGAGGSHMGECTVSSMGIFPAEPPSGVT